MRARLVVSIAILGLIAPFAAGDAANGAGARRAALETEARGVAVELFRTINARRYERTCDLLVAGAGDHALCVAGLRIGFMWSQEIRFRVTGVRLAGDRAFVDALADGAPGRVVLTRVGGWYRVLRVEGA